MLDMRLPTMNMYEQFRFERDEYTRVVRVIYHIDLQCMWGFLQCT